MFDNGRIGNLFHSSFLDDLDRVISVLKHLGKNVFSLFGIDLSRAEKIAQRNDLFFGRLDFLEGERILVEISQNLDHEQIPERGGILHAEVEALLEVDDKVPVLEELFHLIRVQASCGKFLSVLVGKLVHRMDAIVDEAFVEVDGHDVGLTEILVVDGIGLLAHEDRLLVRLVSCSTFPPARRISVCRRIS